MKQVKISSLRMMGVAAFLGLAFTACQTENGQEKYTEFKSAIINFDVTLDSTSSTQVTYIDNYGKVWFEYQQIPNHGLQISTVNDSMEYIIYMEDSTGIKYPATGGINWLSLSDSVINRYKIQKVGQEEVLDRMCDKYTMEMEGMNHQTALCTEWVWKGATLKRVYESGGSTTTHVATDIQIDVEIPAEKVTLPEGIDYENWIKEAKSKNAEEATL